MPSFPGKLTGARARLFAQGCHHFMGAAEDGCNDTPSKFPLFSWLSPHQRISLVADVAVGLLCPDEALPPATLQHYAAYHGVIAYIETQLEIEMDDVYNHDVGEDLMEEFYEKNGPPDDPRFRTEEEQVERAASMALIGKVAAKNKKKLDKKSSIQTEEEEFKPVERRHDIDDTFEQMKVIELAIFSGPPCTEQDRRSPRPLTDIEKSYGFYWRLVCDEAFQEDLPQLTSPLDMIIPPLCMADFCWKSYDFNKWELALHLLMVVKYLSGSINDEESALLYGAIDDVTYADPTQHSRIRAVTKLVKDLRASYDPFWDPSKMAVDQRLIYAVCSEELYHGAAHCMFARSFSSKCFANGFDLAEPGKYQERLEIYRSMEHERDFNDGLDTSYITGRGIGEGKNAPADFEPDSALVFTGCAWSRCSRDRLEQSLFEDSSKFSFPRDEDLKYCARCRVVKYCSKSCQEKHWVTHKRDCRNLAAWRKDKDKVQEIVKEF